MDNRDELIDSDTYKAGGELLEQLDDMGFGATTAGWFYETASADWKLLFITPLIAEKGPQWVYERVLKAVSRQCIHSTISPLHIHISNTTRPYLGQVDMKLDAQGGLPTRIVLRHLKENGVEILEKAVFYRLDTFVKSASARKFDASVRKLAA